MCYSAMVKSNLQDLARRFGAVAIRSQEDEYLQLSQKAPKEFPPLQSRIFPGHFAPIVYRGSSGEKVVELMRYGTYPPSDIGDVSKYTSFNARSDNLRSHFWSNAFMHHHGFIILEGFYEWVAVKDLLKAGVVSCQSVEEEFSRQREARKAKILADGKVYKPTATELKTALERQIIIKFMPQGEEELIVPVIFSRRFGQVKSPDLNGGFAIVTDEPSQEIKAAGHDRCPVILEPGAEQQWIAVEGKSALDFEQLLQHKQCISFCHGLEVSGF